MFPLRSWCCATLATFVIALFPSAPPENSEIDSLLKRFVEEFVRITPGEGKFPATYLRGDNAGAPSERPAQEVKLSKPFSMAKYEVPQDLYQAVMGENPSRWKGVRNSAEMMTWHNAQVFCLRATKLLRQRKLIADEETVRLPTETEWEYCCRAGTTTKYSFGNELRKADDPPDRNSILDKYGWYTGNAKGNDPPVGALAPNPWGLYDMHGYLWEYTTDAWTPNYSDVPATTAARPVRSEEQKIVLRSGSWKDSAERLTSTARIGFGQESVDDSVGFRCVLVKEP